MKILIMFFVLNACATYQSDYDYIVKEDIRYTQKKRDKRIVGDLYLPNKKNAAIVVLVHGGGWESRHKGDMNHIAKSLATNGYAVFNINYRLSPKFQHPAAIEDLHEAVEYMKRHAKKYQLNKNKIALWGYSSGGHTVSYYALKNKKQVNLVVSGGAPYDLSVYPSSGYVKGYLGGFRDQMIDRYKEASPINHVTKDAPAFFLYHAKSDNLVEYEQMINFEKMLKKSSVKHETHSVAFWGHAMTFIISSESIKKGILFLDKNL